MISRASLKADSSHMANQVALSTLSNSNKTIWLGLPIPLGPPTTNNSTRLSTCLRPRKSKHQSREVMMNFQAKQAVVGQVKAKAATLEAAIIQVT
jgi:hypothetical protein